MDRGIYFIRVVDGYEMVVIVVCEYLEKISEGFKVILKDREDFIRLVMIIFGLKM